MRRLADVVQQRRFGERRGRRRVEPELLADQQAERRDVDRVAVGQVLVQLHRENLTERGVAGRDLLDQQLDDVANGGEIDAPSRHHVVERAFGECERQLVGRVERTGRGVGPLHRLPARVERHEPAEADVLNLPRGQLHVDRLAARRVLQLPEELRERQQLVARDAGADVDAVDAKIGQLAQDLRLRFAVLAEGDAVEMRRAMDDVEPQRRRRPDVALHGVVELGELLLDRSDGRRGRGRSAAAG